MTEATLKAALMDQVRQTMPNAVSFRHEDRFTLGIPDISLTDSGLTSWWEAKFANPDILSKGIQDLTMLRLSRRGTARYIIYARAVTKGGAVVDRVVIARPDQVIGSRGQHIGEWNFALQTTGFDHAWVAEQMRQIHERQR